MEFKEVKFNPNIKRQEFELDDSTVNKFKIQNGKASIFKPIFMSEPTEESLDNFIEAIVELDAMFFELEYKFKPTIIGMGSVDFEKKLYIITGE